MYRSQITTLVCVKRTGFWPTHNLQTWEGMPGISHPLCAFGLINHCRSKVVQHSSAFTCQQLERKRHCSCSTSRMQWFNFEATDPFGCPLYRIKFVQMHRWSTHELHRTVLKDWAYECGVHHLHVVVVQQPPQPGQHPKPPPGLWSNVSNHACPWQPLIKQVSNQLASWLPLYKHTIKLDARKRKAHVELVFGLVGNERVMCLGRFKCSLVILCTKWTLHRYVLMNAPAQMSELTVRLRTTRREIRF